MQANPIRVGIVDDNEMIRYGLSAALDALDDLVLVGEAQNGVEAIALCEASRPDVLLVDLVMPGMDGVALIRHVRQYLPTIQCLALTSYDEADLVQDAIQAGAVSYLIKNISIVELGEAVRAAYAGRSIFAREALESLRNKTAARTTPPPKLSEIHLRVLGLLVRGYNEETIAAALSIETSEVKTQLADLMVLLNAATRTELVVIALRDYFVGAS